MFNNSPPSLNHFLNLFALSITPFTAAPMSESPNVPTDNSAELPPDAGENTEPFVIKHLVWKGLILESGLLLIAVVIGSLGFREASMPLSQIVSDWIMPCVWGVIATLPMFLALLVVDLSPSNFFRPIQTVGDQLLEPLFRGMEIWKFVLISASAGIGEEMFFRWMLQGGIASLFGSPVLGAVMAIGAAALVFGFCHWLNLTYAIFAFFVGVYLGLLMILTDSIVAPIVTHALYDLVALIYVTRFRSRLRNRLDADVG